MLIIITTAETNEIFFSYFLGKIRLDISCESSAWQVQVNLLPNVWFTWFVCVEVLQPSQPKWGHVKRGQFTQPHVYWAGLVLQAVNQYCAHSFARNWQLPFLNQRKGENDRRKYFMINLHERMYDSHEMSSLVSLKNNNINLRISSTTIFFCTSTLSV